MCKHTHITYLQSDKRCGCGAAAMRSPPIPIPAAPCVAAAATAVRTRRGGLVHLQPRAGVAGETALYLCPQASKPRQSCSASAGAPKLQRQAGFEGRAAAVAAACNPKARAAGDPPCGSGSRPLELHAAEDVSRSHTCSGRGCWALRSVRRVPGAVAQINHTHHLCLLPDGAPQALLQGAEHSCLPLPSPCSPSL